MTTWSRFLLLLLGIAWTSVSTEAVKEKGNHLAVVHVIDALPKKSKPMSLECKSGRTHEGLGQQTLNVGDDYKWNVEENATYYCSALWGRYFGSWHGFQPRRDVGHGTIYWRVKDNGFLLSWDRTSWVRKGQWETE
ncbi:hypothetical protein CJ030_MR3G026089 [Morella rubra]|uniref:S-protein homolog n=1 Tax=Morella rubra TaxID=262757 RepID=A0A6A1VZ17_9ROSI|nr:hypothetical protein CJ030_MR3G026089 [Morella rubra]